MTLSQRISKGVRVTFTATLVSGSMQAVFMLVLLRLLQPESYGIYAASVAIVAITLGLVGGAFERSLIVSPDGTILDGRAIPLALTVSAAAFLLFSGIVMLRMSGLVKPPIVPLIILSLSQVVSALGTIARVHLRRSIAFGLVAASELAGQFLGAGLAAISLAFLGWGPYALLIGALVQSLATTLILVARTPPRLLWPPRWKGYAEIANDARRLAMSSSIEVVRVQIPVFIVGLLGAAALGTFNRAYNIVQLPLQLLTTSISRVAITGIVSVAEDIDRRRRATRILASTVSAATAPIALGLSGASKSFTMVIMGPRWEMASNLLPWLAVATLCSACGHCFGILAEGMRAFELKARVQFICAIVLAIFMLAGSIRGVEGAAAGMAAASIVYLSAHIMLASWLLQTNISTIFTWINPGLVAGAMCFFFTFFASKFHTSEGYAMLLLVQVVGCGAICAVYYFTTQRDFINEISSLARPRNVSDDAEIR